MVQMAVTMSPFHQILSVIFVNSTMPVLSFSLSIFHSQVESCLNCVNFTEFDIVPISVLTLLVSQIAAFTDFFSCDFAFQLDLLNL